MKPLIQLWQVNLKHFMSCFLLYVTFYHIFTISVFFIIFVNYTYNMQFARTCTWERWGEFWREREVAFFRSRLLLSWWSFLACLPTCTFIVPVDGSFLYSGTLLKHVQIHLLFHLLTAAENVSDSPELSSSNTRRPAPQGDVASTQQRIPNPEVEDVSLLLKSNKTFK